jgi:quercetin dioxygenase-like cupin family protein
VTISKHRFVVASAVLFFSFGWTSLLSAKDAVYRPEVVSKKVLSTNTTATGEALVYPVTDHPEVTGLEVVIPPGGETGWHRHPVAGFAYVISGELTLLYEGKARRVFGAGEAFAEAVRTAHNGRNLGKLPVRLVAFFLGQSGSPVAETVTPVPR